MAKFSTKRGTTSKLARLFIQDSSSTTGAGLTGLTNASSGLVAYYICEGDSSPTSIVLSSGTVGTWSSGGFKEVSSSNLPGVYELGIPNLALATGGSVLIMLKGATNMVPCVLEYELDAVDYQDATAFGMSRLDSAITSVAASILATPSIKLNTVSGGYVQQDMTQVVPSTNTVQTVGDALNAARAQGFGKWNLSGTTLTLYAGDGATVVRTFTLDNATAPTARA